MGSDAHLEAGRPRTRGRFAVAALLLGLFAVLLLVLGLLSPAGSNGAGLCACASSLTSLLSFLFAVVGLVRVRRAPSLLLGSGLTVGALALSIAALLGSLGAIVFFVVAIASNDATPRSNGGSHDHDYDYDAPSYDFD